MALGKYRKKISSKKNFGVRKVNNLPVYIVCFIVLIFVLIILNISLSKINKQYNRSQEQGAEIVGFENLIAEIVGDNRTGIVRPPEQKGNAESSNKDSSQGFKHEYYPQSPSTYPNNSTNNYPNGSVHASPNDSLNGYPNDFADNYSGRAPNGYPNNNSANNYPNGSLNGNFNTNMTSPVNGNSRPNFNFSSNPSGNFAPNSSHPLGFTSGTFSANHKADLAMIHEKKDQLADTRFRSLQRALTASTEVNFLNNAPSTTTSTNNSILPDLIGQQLSLLKGLDQNAMFSSQIYPTPNGTNFTLPNSDSKTDQKKSYADFDKKEPDRWSLNEFPRSPLTEFTVQTGFIIPAILLSTIVSEIPGPIIAQTSKNIYDSKTGKHLLIPQGSRLIGTYDSKIEHGQSRILIAWQRLLFPNGKTLDIGAMPGTDIEGIAGFHDKVDNHYGKIFGSAILMSAIVGGMAYASDTGGSPINAINQAPNLKSELSAAFGQQLGQTSLKLLEQNLDISPTLEIRKGYRFNIIITKDISLPSPYKD